MQKWYPKLKTKQICNQYDKNLAATILVKWEENKFSSFGRFLYVQQVDTDRMKQDLLGLRKIKDGKGTHPLAQNQSHIIKEQYSDPCGGIESVSHTPDTILDLVIFISTPSRNSSRVRRYPVMMCNC